MNDDFKKLVEDFSSDINKASKRAEGVINPILDYIDNLIDEDSKAPKLDTIFKAVKKAEKEKPVIEEVETKPTFLNEEGVAVSLAEFLTGFNSKENPKVNSFQDFLNDTLSVSTHTQDAADRDEIPEQDVDLDLDFVFVEDDNGEYKKHGSIEEYIRNKDGIQTGGVDFKYTEYPLNNFGPMAIPDIPAFTTKASIDAHYDFEYAIDDADLKRGTIKIDPYLVCEMWEINKKDPTGCLFHMLKNIARMGAKVGNTSQREVDGLYATLARFCELNDLDNSL